ncbi:hypothetical protein GCM10027053_26210 [Intrasporangium mesophilum]
MADHEIRFALVMNGGVSLAVWIAGVTHEIDLIRRASTDGLPGPRAHDEKVHAMWRNLLRPAKGRQHRLVVDVLAGTSAGGLNSVMLANVIAHNGTLDPVPDPHDVDPVVPPDAEGPWLREVWCSLGGLRQGNLLPKPGQSTGSVLDGAFFLTSAEKIMKKLAATGRESEPRSDHEHPVTLFTTASGLGRQQYTATDAADQTFDVTDHRFVYRFTTDKPFAYDPAQLSFIRSTDQGSDFADPRVLALAARASASFPVAFQPVRELKDLNKVPPRRRPRAVSATGSWLMDGGVLDNAPFAPVLDAIAKGPVTGDISRYVVYVVPSAGIGTDATKVETTAETAPTWVTTLASAVQFPREVDFRSDVEELEQLRVEADTAWSDAQNLYESAVSSAEVRSRVLAAAECLQPTYTRGRAAGAVWEAIGVGEAGRVTLLDKDAAEPMKAADEILDKNIGCTPPIGYEIVTLTRGGAGEAPKWPWGLGPAERVIRTVLRSARTHLKKVMDAADSTDAGAPETNDTADRSSDLENRLERLSAARRKVISVRAAVELAIGDGYMKLAQPPDGGRQRRRPTVFEVADLVKQVFEDLRVQEALGQVIATLERELPDGEVLLRTALAIEVVSRCTSSRTPDQRSAPFSFVRLGTDVDLPVLGPEGQALATGLGNRILFGTQVGHFGAFGADDWRRWDWLMGRLHAASHIGMLLHNPATPEEREAAAEWIRDVQAEIIKAEDSTVPKVLEGLETLRTEYQDSNLGYGLARMLDAMNASDHERAPEERSTQQLGDRLIAVAPGLGTTPGDWIQAVASRTETAWLQALARRREGAKPSAGQRVARWFFAPLRASLWDRLTRHDLIDEPTSGLLTLLAKPPWAMVLVAGLVVLGSGVVATYEDLKSVGLLLVCLGVALVLVGGAGLALVGIVRHVRDALGGKFTGLLDHWLPPRRS